MKIGILTFHKAINYGAVLQAWALQYFLKTQGFNCKIIDYHCIPVENNYKPFSFLTLKKQPPLDVAARVLSGLRHFQHIRRRTQKFNAFINENFSLVSMLDISTLNAIIVGSDQIWNPSLTGGTLDDTFLLINKEFSHCAKLSYAASSETSFISGPQHLLKLTTALEDFDWISVREKSLAELLSQKATISVCTTVDPTLLLDANDYEPIIVFPRIKHPYIFVYQVNYNNSAMAIAHKKAEELGCDIIYLNSRFSFRRKEKNICCDVGPKEFLGLIKNAAYVITTSFHGLVFSMLFKKQFIVPRIEHMGRQINLLKLLNLQDRIIENVADETEAIGSDINYNDIDYLEMERIKNESIKFIQRINGLSK